MHETERILLVLVDALQLAVMVAVEVNIVSYTGGYKQSELTLLCIIK